MRQGPEKENPFFSCQTQDLTEFSLESIGTVSENGEFNNFSEHCKKNRQHNPCELGWQCGVSLVSKQQVTTINSDAFFLPDFEFFFISRGTPPCSGFRRREEF